MFSFYTIVIIIAIILLIFALSVIGVTLAKNENQKPFPEHQNTCPDFWKLEESHICRSQGINTVHKEKVAEAKNHAGVNVSANGNGIDQVTSIDISPDNWVGVCDKSAWAKKYNILWDGVTNNNNCA